jgi:spore coat polysaccharide biosynthesis protein SpsF
LLPLGGAPVIDHVIDRVRRAEGIDGVVAAITDDPLDGELEVHLDACGVQVVRGDTDDVLARFDLAARAASADVVVRVTGDCPLIDPGAVADVVAAFSDEPEIDYCANILKRTYPIGMDAEVFSRDALTTAVRDAVEKHEREHVTPYLYQHPELFKLRNVEAPEWAVAPELRLTLDQQEDYEMLSLLFERLGDDATLREVMTLLEAEPEIAQINGSVVHRHVAKPESW